MDRRLRWLKTRRGENLRLQGRRLVKPAFHCARRRLRIRVRHLDFHPSGKWAFVTLERQNQIRINGRMPDGTLSDSPLFVRSTLKMDPAKSGPDRGINVDRFPQERQVCVCGQSRFRKRRREFHRGVLRQSGYGRADSGTKYRHAGIPAQNFYAQFRRKVSRSGKSGGAGCTRCGRVTPFRPASRCSRVGADGRLGFAHKYDVETSAGRVLFWAGFVSLP